MNSAVSAARLPVLDMLRGVAVLMVYFAHTLGAPAGGVLGVDIFFPLSGFLISSMLIDEFAKSGYVRFHMFYLRRATRLLPAFICTIFLYGGIRFFLHPEQPFVGIYKAVQVLFLSDWNRDVPALAHVWSLSVEWQFYFVWPFILVVLMKIGVSRAQIALICLTIIVALWSSVSDFGEMRSRVGGLLLGAALACLADNPYLIRPGGHPRIEQTLFVAALLSAVAFSFLPAPTRHLSPPSLGYVLMPVLCVLMIGLALRLQPSTGHLLLCNPLLVYFGRISYGLYLYHFLIIFAFWGNFNDSYGPFAKMLCYLLVCVPLAELSFRYVEQPLLRLGRRRHPPLAAPARLSPRPVT